MTTNEEKLWAVIIGMMVGLIFPSPWSWIVLITIWIIYIIYVLNKIERDNEKFNEWLRQHEKKC